MSRDDPNRRMDIREYKEYAKSKHGDKSINDSLLKNINKATGGRTLSRSEFDKVNAKIKVAQELKK